MAELLNFGGYSDWARSLQKLKLEIEGSFGPTVATILAMYGGMGSLNDVVLYKDGQPLVEENIELDILRCELYHLCHGI